MIKENFYIGNYKQEAKRKGGWFIGHFMESGLRKTDKFEVKYWEFPPGKTNHKLKALCCATEITLLLKGKIIGKIEDKKRRRLEEIKLEAGDYVIILPKIVNGFPEIVLEYAEGITIKIPSIENDKREGENYEEIINKLKSCKNCEFKK